MPERNYFDAKTTLLCLTLAAVIHGSNCAVRRCCSRLYKHTHRGIHPHINLIHRSSDPRRVVLRTLTEYLNEEELNGHFAENEAV
jgi:hypothetical protein